MEANYQDYFMVRINIHKTLKSQSSALNLDIDLEIKQGEFLTVYGPSGAGKTSLLRLIAGLLKADQGHIEVDNAIWFDSTKGINLAPNHRSTGLVFQDYALFPNLTVLENLKFGLKEQSEANLLDEITKLMELTDLLHRKPIGLSGGQLQRVALGRSLVTRPKILMLDEPLAALDNEMRTKIQDYLLDAHKRYNLTTILVSHDVGEIFKLSSRVVSLANGQIVADGSPDEVFLKDKRIGKFQFAGEVLEIHEEEVIYIVTVLIGSQLVKVIAEESVAHGLRIGDKVLVTSKAFNPIIQKISQ